MFDNDDVNRDAASRFESRSKERDDKRKLLEQLKSGKDTPWQLIDEVSRIAERARHLGMVDAARELVQEPSDSAAGKRVYEKILGANNLLGIEFVYKGARVSRAIGRITLPVTNGTRLGTGFMISPRVLMTNNHVLSDRFEAGNASIEFDFYRRDDGTTGPVTSFRLRPNDLFVTDAALDFTIVAVEESNGSGDLVKDRGWLPLIGASGKAVVGERVSIIQHPGGEPQQVAIHENRVVDVFDDFLHYKTDTMGGSSGSPVLNINWDLAALHHAAVQDSNEGVRVSRIVARLREIFDSESSESGASNSDARLVAGVLSAQPTPDPDSSLGSDKHYTSPIEATCSDGPQVNADGTTSWIIPLSVTVGVGQQVVCSTAAPTPARIPAVTPSSSTDNSDALSDDPRLQSSLQALQEAGSRVYYSETKDKVAIEEYYGDADALAALTKTRLYDRLSQLLRETHTTTLSYNSARLNHLYPWIDRREGTTRPLKGIYSNKEFDAREVIVAEVRAEIARAEFIRERALLESFDPDDEALLEELEAAHPFNCEHVVPQSWFNKRKQPKTDMHHLFTCEWGCNSFRGNHAYFDFSQEAFRDNCGERETGKFEPHYGKGAVARATLYFLLRYPGDIADSAKEMPKDRIRTIIDWAKNDKVDRWERHRNAEIQRVQGNRNPLIDFPEWADKIAFERGFA